MDRIFDIINNTGVVENLMQEDDLSFDWHSSAVRHLLQEATLAKLIRGVRTFLPGTHIGKNGNTGEEN
jgi:hypothetical protein